MIRLLSRHPLQPRGHTPLIAKLFRDLLDETVKAPLAKGVGGVALAFRDRLGPGQPAEDKMGEGFEAQRGIPFNLALPPVEGIHPRQQPLFQHGPRFGNEQGQKGIIKMPKLLSFTNLTRTHSSANVIHSYSHSIVPGGLDVMS